MWFYYPEAGHALGAERAHGRARRPSRTRNERDASFVVPKNCFKPGTMHFILAVTDNGAPALTRYRRVIVNVAP